MIPAVFFWILSAFIVAGALGVALSRHPIYAVLSLVMTLFSLSVLFLFLSAPFVAIIQILVYAGAILVLFLFVVMLLDMAPEALRIRGNTLRLLGLLAGTLFLTQIIEACRWWSAAPPASGPLGTTEEIGKLLFTTYALPFEVASLLLLVGIVGAVVLAKKKLP